MIDTKIEEIVERRGFKTFWEVFDYTLMAGYSELDALKISLELFEGNIWKDVISFRPALYGNYVESEPIPEPYVVPEPTPEPIPEPYTAPELYGNYVEPDSPDENGVTINTGIVIGMNGYTCISEPDNLHIVLHIMTNNANQNYEPLYKAYIECRKYNKIAELDNNIKKISLILKTELAIEMFKDKII